MLHDFRPSPSDGWICAGCGRHFDRCVGLKSDYLGTLMGLSRAQEPTMFTPAPGVRALFGKEFSYVVIDDYPIEPANIGRRSLIERRIEELVARVALLRLEANDDPARRAVYESWAAYDAAMAQASYMERHDKTIREIQELERWRTL